MQNYYNLLYREEEREMIPLCAAEGIGLIPWSPLARGYLARRSFDDKSTARSTSDEFADRLYDPAIDEAVVRRNAEVADRLGVPPAQVALAWLLAKPGVSAPIIGASKPQHLEDALASLQLKLSGDDVKTLEDAYRPHGMLGLR